jgi:hypothetical protein
MVGGRPEVFEALGESRSESVTEEIRAFGGVGTAARVALGWLTHDGGGLVVSTAGGNSRASEEKKTDASFLGVVLKKMQQPLSGRGSCR